MAFPTSTIVLALITAVPFGFAIRDQLSGKELGPVDEESAALEELARAQREYEQHEAAQQKARDASIALLVGDEPAVFSLAGVSLGMPAAEITPEIEASVRALEKATQSNVALEVANGVLREIVVSTSYEDDRCEGLRKQLESVWPSKQVRNEPSDAGDLVSFSYWANDDRLSRAIYNEAPDACRLRFESYVHVSAWLNETRDSVVPLWALKRPAKELLATLGDRAVVTGEKIRWTGPGVGLGDGETELFARVVKGKVVTIAARHVTLVDTTTAINDRIQALNSDGAYTGRLGFIQTSAGHLELEYGQELPRFFLDETE